MYRDHVPKIASAMRQSPDIFARGVMFAVLSARTPFVTVPDQLAELDRDGAQARCLWTWKIDAYHYLTDNKRELWQSVCNAPDTETALQIITTIPGLGIVKGAFVLQLLGHDCACLDVRNIIREGRNPRAYRSDGGARKTTPAFKRKIARYLADTGGKAQFYWDAWCIDVAATYQLSPDECSALHLAIIPRGFRLTKRALAHIPLTSDAIPF